MSGSKSIIAAFIDHAQQTPDCPCLSFAGSHLNYGELHLLALGWAAQLG